MQVARGIAIELHEHKVPDLDVARYVSGKRVVGLAGLQCSRPVVVENLRTRSAGPGVPHLPEVILLVAPVDAVQRHARDFLPQPLSLVVFAENGNVQAVIGQPETFRDEFPSESDSVLLEVIAKRKVSQHLEEGEMRTGPAHVLKIVVLAASADALLGGRCARVGSGLVTEEHVLELVHSGVREE